MKKRALVDLSWVMYRSFYAYGNLSVMVKGMSRPTGHIYGTARVVEGLLKNEDLEVVLCKDGAKKGKGLVSEYKEGRPNQLFNILGDVQNVIDLLTIANRVSAIGDDNLEADEVMYSLASDSTYKNYIYTGDNDLLQALQFRTAYLLKGINLKVKGNVYSLEDYYKDEKLSRKFYFCSPENLPYFRALVGDKSDNLRGIDRIPRMLALDLAEYIKADFPDIDTIISKCAEPRFGKTLSPTEMKYLSKVKEEWGRISDNVRIMKLDVVNDLKEIPRVRPAEDLTEEFEMSSWKEFLKKEGNL